MNTVKTASASLLGNLRSSARSASPAPVPPMDTGALLDLTHPLTPVASRGRVKTLTTLAAFRRAASPAPTASATPPPTLVQDGTYLQVLGLKLSEAVTKALAQPTGPPVVGEAVVDGRRPLPAGRGKAIASLIASELRASEANAQLHRAILRLIQRPLSMLNTSLNAGIMPLITSPHFVPPVPSQPSAQCAATQTIALSYAGLAAEVLECFDTLGLGLQHETSASLQPRGGAATGDSLKAIREGLESVVNRVLSPLLSSIKFELVQPLEALEQQAPAPSLPLKSSTQSKNGSWTHPSVITLTRFIPIHSRALLRYTSPPSIPSQTLQATFIISLVWRAMVSLSNRGVPPQGRTPPESPTIPSPPPLTKAPSNGPKRRIGPSTPPTTPSANRFLMKLPSSRPPSPPPAPMSPLETLVADAKAVYDLLNSLPKPSAELNKIAHEAVDEAFEAFQELVALLSAASPRWDTSTVPQDVPTLVALPVLLRTLPSTVAETLDPAAADGRDIALSPAQLIGLGEKEYREGCLSGFGRANECGPLVAKRLHDILARRPEQCPQLEALLEWLRIRYAN